MLSNLQINGFDLNKYTFEEYKLKCGEEITITAEAWNIGSNDQEQVSLQIYNKEMGINEILELGDIDAFENADINFKLKIPKNIEGEKWYTIKIGIYDEDNNLFENSQDDLSEFNLLIELDNTCGVYEPGISAELLTEAKENSEMIIKVTIKNSGTKEVIYDINAAGFADWAELIEIDQRQIIIPAGLSKDVSITLKTKKDSSGERFFNIEIFSDSKLVTKQPVLVTIGDTGTPTKDFLQKNWKLLIIGLVNLILIITIIVVAVRTYRR